MNEDKIIIKKTGKGRFFLILGAIAMSVVALVLALLPVDIIISITGISAPAFIIAFRAFMLFGAAFFGFCFIFIISKPKELLIADEKGITDRSSAIALGFIPWSDVASIRLCLFMEQKFIEVELKNEDKYLNGLGWFKKNAIKANKKMQLQAVLITLNGSGVCPETVLPKLETLFERHRV